MINDTSNVGVAGGSASASGALNSNNERTDEELGVRPIFSRVPVPTINSDNIETWFVQLESWFSLNKIRSDKTKFDTVVAYVDGKLLSQVYNIVSDPPEYDKFLALKSAIIANFGDSEQRRIQKLISGLQLGDKRPSHLLNDLRKIGGKVDDNLLKNLWMQRLPSQAKSIVAAAKGSLNELAIVADAVCESLDLQSIGSIDSSSSVSQQTTIAALQQQVEFLSKSVDILKKDRSRSRSQSKNRTNNNDNSWPKQPTCWYHRKFGSGATKCRKPCDFPEAGPKN